MPRQRRATAAASVTGVFVKILSPVKYGGEIFPVGATMQVEDAEVAEYMVERDLVEILPPASSG